MAAPSLELLRLWLRVDVESCSGSHSVLDLFLRQLSIFFILEFLACER